MHESDADTPEHTTAASPTEDPWAFAVPGHEVVYVEVTEGVFAPVRAAEARWRSLAQAMSDTTEPAGGDRGPDEVAEPTIPDPPAPTKAELLDPTSALTPAERWAGLVGAAPGMTIAEKQQATVALLRTEMADYQIESVLNALFPPSP